MRSPSEVDVWDALFDTHSVGMANPSPADVGHAHTRWGAGFQPAGYSWLRKSVKVPTGMLAPVVLNLRGLEARAPVRPCLMLPSMWLGCIEPRAGKPALRINCFSSQEPSFSVLK